jgi:hypothetical protein
LPIEYKVKLRQSLYFPPTSLFSIKKGKRRQNKAIIKKGKNIGGKIKQL